MGSLRNELSILARMLDLRATGGRVSWGSRFARPVLANHGAHEPYLVLAGSLSYELVT